MEIEIQSKTNNPLLNRTEVRFIIHHKGEGSPKRDLIKGELAEKLKVKKENVMVNYMKSSFGSTETFGYAKVFTSVEKAKSGEREHILVRNAVIAAKKPVKEEKKPPVKPEVKAETKEEVAEKPEEEKPTEEKPVEKVEESEKPAERESTEKPAGEKKSTEGKPEEEQKVAEKPEKEQPTEEKKEEP
jgi:small subunit ribosomal protein S24e